MEFLHNQNLTQPEVTHWESAPHLSSAVNNTIIVLGVLTFALQLCLVLFFMLRCWRFDSKVTEAPKHPEAGNKLIEHSSFHQNIYKQASDHPCVNRAAASLSAMPAAAEDYEPVTNSPLPFAPSITWDLLQ